MPTALPAAVTGRAARRRAQLRRRNRSRLTAFLAVPALVVGLLGAGVWGVSTAAAAALPAPTADIALRDSGGAHGDADEKPFILAGEDATFDVSMTNEAASAGGYNIGFTLALPAGISFVSSGMGTPVVYGPGATLPNSSRTSPLATVPAGQQLWVFEDVADLPATADYTSSITVRPAAASFPVGASPAFTVTGYISSDPTLKPIFDGSTGVGGTAALNETSSGADGATAPVRALRLTKHEPSPEIELLRGVHDHQTVYELTVENTPQGTTNGVTVVDYLPAGLEFLGCAQDDNTQPSDLLFGDGTREYPGAGTLVGTAPADCLEPVTVETVDTGLPAGLPAGVYTKVTWQLPPLSGATAQAYPNTAGTPGVRTIRYAAAVPLFENTMDFVTTGGTGTPATDGAQASNLNNNNGASTRQGQADGFNDGVLYENSATVAGTYAGPLAAGASAAASDTDTEEIQAMDLRVLKSVDTGAGEERNDFVTGDLATFTLNLATSEYTSSGRMTVTDVIPNGLCPALPATVTRTGDDWPAECLHPWPAGARLEGAEVTSVHYDAEAGEFTLTFAPDPEILSENGQLDIVYTALMRPTYTDDDEYVGSTSSGDAVVNHVEIEGWTTSRDALDGVTNGDGVPAFGDEDVWDDSAAEIVSDYSGISKRVLARDAVRDANGTPSAEDVCAVPSTDGAWAENHTDPADVPFVPGDVVCYELTVDYASQIDVRNPLVTDFLPTGVTYLDYAVADETTDGLEVPAPVQQGQRVDWVIGTPGAEGDRFVPQGSRLVLHVLGQVTSWTPNDEAELDRPENLMKYQQENVEDELYFLRDASAILTGQGPSLLKGVRDVDGVATAPARSQGSADGTAFDSDRDGIRVVQGDIVTYRVDLTGGTSDVVDMVVWDALPEGIVADDVDAISAGGTALDPTDAGYPTTLPAEYDGRSVIVWTGVDLAAGATATLTYDVTIPDSALVSTEYPNTASITQYALPLNTGGENTVYPTDSLDASTHPEIQTVPGEGTRDDSTVYTPDPAIDKSVVSSEVSPATANLDPAMNGATQIVQGELVTYEYSVTVPAHTSVRNGVLQDRGTLSPGTVAFTATGGDWEASALTGAAPGDFTFAVTPGTGTARGVLTFPTTYSNTSDADQVFTVTLTGYVGDAGGNETTLTNQAGFTSASWDGTAQEQVVYREPNPQIDKTATPDDAVAIGQPVTYTLDVTNGPNRVKSYDNVVTDTVPAGLVVDTASITPAPFSVEPGVAAGDGGEIVWHLAEIPPTAQLTYTASIAPNAGAGEAYRNVAEVEGRTLPASLGGTVQDRRGTRTDTDEATVDAITADIAKGVRLADSTGAYADTVGAPVGETVEYVVVTTLRANINYYDVRILDDLPAGAELIEASVTGPDSDSATIDGSWSRTRDAATNTWTWTYDEQIASAPVDRTLTLSYEVLLSDAIAQDVASLPNIASFTWNTIAGNEDTRSSIDDDATVTVLNPVPAIDKSVSDPAPDPGEEFDYTVTVTNTGNTPAYNLVVTDTIPDGVIVDAATISRGGALTGATATGGGTITWDAADLPGPLHPQSSTESPRSIALTYSAVLAPSGTIGDGEQFTNTARVTRLESFDEGGRVYEPTTVQDTAVVDPPFPNVTLTKTTTAGDTAYAEQPFGWTLTLVNTGDGPAETIAVTDVLPENWEYDAGSAQIRVGTGAPLALDDPEIDEAGAVQTLTWDADAVSTVTPALPGTASGAPAAQRTIVITFTATPTEAALTDAGVTTEAGVRVPHTNTLSAVTTDTSGETGNADGPYTGPQDTADAFIHSADVVLQKDPGPGLAAGGAAGVAWTITVSNDGPDAAAGPFTVTDDWGALPAGFTITGVSGTGWSCDALDADGFECVRTNTADTLADGASFPVITVTAQAAAGFDPADSPVANEATVTAGTSDPDPDNTDDAEVPVSANADLAIEKTGPATAPNAGGPLAWTLTVRNDGPADSVSAAGDLITVSDTIPEGVDGVSLGALPAGWTAAEAGPFDSGDTVTLTLDAGLRLTPGQTVAFTLTGTVSPSLEPGTPIDNTATVTAGVTEDPNPDNDRSTVSATPTTNTTLGVTKTRQVLDGGVWRDATASDATVPGEPVTYLVTVANTGTADARSVTVTDEVPDYLTYTTFESVTGTWNRTSTTAGAGDDQAFALTGLLTPGTSAALRVTLAIDPEYDEPVVNWVQAGAVNATNTPRDSDGSDATRSANLALVKSHTGTAVAGSTLPYRLQVTNEGPSFSSGPIVITDILPTGFGYQAGSATVSIAGGTATAIAPVVDGQTLTWTLGTVDGFALANGAGITVDFTATIAADVPEGTYTNLGSVSGPDDTDPADNTDEDPTPLTTSADLSVAKTAAAGPYVAGQTVTYTIAVTNAGPSVARDVAVADQVPSGMTVTAMSGDGWTCDVATALCERDVLPLGTSTLTVTAAIAASVPAGTELTNVATVTSSTPDPTGPVTDDAEVEVTALADLALIKTAVDEDGAEITQAAAGTSVRYLLEVVNNGSSDAVGPLRIADTLPEGLTYESVAQGAAAWTCAVDPSDAQALTCENPTGLAAGAQSTDLVIVAAIDPAQPLGTIVNVAGVSSPTPDPQPANNSDDAPLEITQSADLSIVKTHDAGEVRIGDELTFALDVRNDGPSDATEVTVVDTLPAGLEYVDAGATDGAWTVEAAAPAADGTTTVTATLSGTLVTGEAAPPLEVTVLVHPEAYAEVANVATVGAAQPDPDPADNTSEDSVTVPPLAQLVLEKVAVGTFQVGSDAGYLLTLTNTGLTEDPGPIVIEDALPAGIGFRSATGDGVTCAEAVGTVSCTVDDPLAVGASVTVRIAVSVGYAAFPEVVNTAVVSSPSEQGPDAQLAATATTPVQAEPLPATGGALPALWVAAGLALAVAGALLVVMRRRRTV
jgi:uncharacterized repeat protein (TIGR01451 family)/fimbrial isopeptide formation D2 family protein/LPXTG-motif cell wall-anchored protein